ncbi:MAG: hypothetical protein ACRBBW_17095 [Cellvibrionaceae bacterium]
MTRIFSLLALCAGAAVIAWTATGFVYQNTLALGVTLSIAVGFLVGCFELWRYQYATQSLTSALDEVKEPVNDLESWLSRVDVGVRESTRLRVKGEHVGLPVPVLTPYLIGLLVMLGLLGTFIGMVDMLQGAVTALKGSTELEAVRAGLAEPIGGLGLAFGTSVAGVAASAALGLMSTLSRRDRLAASRYLDRKINQVFCEFSLLQKRERTFDILQTQSKLMPDVSQRLMQLSENLEAFCQDLGERLLENQKSFNDSVDRHFSGLTESVSQALSENLSANVRRSTEIVEPALVALTDQVAQQTQSTQKVLTQSVAEQIEKIGDTLQTQSDALAEHWQSGLEAQQQSNERVASKIATQLDLASSELINNSNDANTASIQKLMQLLEQSQVMIETREKAEAQWLAQQNTRLESVAETLISQFSSLRDEESARGELAQQRLELIQTSMSDQLQKLSQSFETPMKTLIDSAAQAPQAAAQVISQMREEVSQSVARDNQLLTECTSILSDLSGLREGWQSSAEMQVKAVEVLVAESQQIMQSNAEQLTQNADVEATRLTQLSEQMMANTAEMMTLGETFSVAVNHYGDANQQLVENLVKIDEALQTSANRSDEQMQYYVAQAREIIDHTMLSHQQLMDQLRSISRRGEVLEEA